MRILLALSILLFCSCNGSDGGQEIGPGELGLGGGSPRWVAVGDSGCVFFSDDGLDWTQSTHNATDDLLHAVSNDGHNLWVAVGSKTAIYSTNSGVDWTKGDLDGAFDRDLYGLANDGQGRWGAVGHNKAIFGSLDGGKHWATTDITFDLGGIRDVASDGTNWMGVGTSGTNAYSADIFKLWIEGAKPDSSKNLESVATDGAGKWVAVGNVGYIQFSDDDGQNWAGEQLGTHDLRGVATDGEGNWVAVGGPEAMFFSSDGEDWQSATDVGGIPVVEDVDTDGTVWIAVGSGGNVYRSEDMGDTWNYVDTLVDSATSQSPALYSVVWGK